LFSVAWKGFFHYNFAIVWIKKVAFK